MDFDDLDDAINERLAQGEELEGVAGLLAASASKLKEYEPREFMPPIPRQAQKLVALEDLPAAAKKGLPKEPAQKEVCIRAFVLCGEGESSESFARLLASAPASVDAVAYEWPAHGLRGSEAPSGTLDALVDDAMEALGPAMTELAAGGKLEGAPFVLIGSAAGALLAAALAARLRRSMSLEPSAVVVLDRAPPHMPLLSPAGLELLSSDPDGFVRAFRPEAGGLPTATLKAWLNDIALSCQTLKVGSHLFSCELLVLRAKDSAKVDEHAKCKFKPAVLRIDGTEETLTIPVLGSTRVGALRKALAEAAGVDAESISLVQEGASAAADHEAAADAAVVRGLKSFKPKPYEWPHPVAIIGAGYNGIKTAMEYLKEGRENIAVFDRNDKVGGHCWITAANKDSKLQTEFAAFHVWFGPEYVSAQQCGGPGVWPTGWDCWTGKEQVLKHFQYAAEQYGVTSHVHFQTNVSSLEIVGGATSHDRYYKLRVDSLKKGEGAPKPFDFVCSLMYNFPGSMTRHRIIEYPGEDEFGGQIGYGMSDDFTYDERLRGARAAIIGNGAFAVENARTCIEHAAEKVYLITRRKNLASPRLPCWFVHQGPIPTPGRMVLKMFEPMYELCGMGDPWKYSAVHASADRQNVSIIQNSRFGIGDVTFLAVAYGKLEYVEDTVKRMSRSTLHLNGGGKLEGVTSVVKSLGLLGDWAVDKLHHQTQMSGMWCDGDWRRVLAIDPTGMNAANFTTFSLGIGVHSNIKTFKYFHDFPEEYYKAEKAGLLQSLPVSKADEKLDKPAYVTDVKYAMSAGIILSAFCPMVNRLTAFDGQYKYVLFHQVHKFDEYLEQCIADWNRYQEMFKSQGCTHDYITYPYTKDMVKKYIDDYNKDLGATLSIEGPSQAEAESLLKSVARDEREVNGIMFTKPVSKALHSYAHGDPVELLQRSLAHAERAKLTFSAAESAMDFDLRQFSEWEQWANQGKCVVEDVEADHYGIREHPSAIQKIYDLCVRKQARRPGQ